jgi:hypothetical protein
MENPDTVGFQTPNPRQRFGASLYEIDHVRHENSFVVISFLLESTSSHGDTLIEGSQAAVNWSSSVPKSELFRV